MRFCVCVAVIGGGLVGTRPVGKERIVSVVRFLLGQVGMAFVFRTAREPQP